MKIYLDNCCYNRPFDNQKQERVHLERMAANLVLGLRVTNPLKFALEVI